MSATTAGVILRALVNLEADGGDTRSSANPSCGPRTSCESPVAEGDHPAPRSGIRASRPVMFSTFLMWVLADLFTFLPEVRRPRQAQVVFFFDEAHLLLQTHPRRSFEQVEQTVKLIRSKGVGVIFCTQLPTDVPNEVLSQLVPASSAALRAFTPTTRRPCRRRCGPTRRPMCATWVGVDLAGHR